MFDIEDMWNDFSAFALSLFLSAGHTDAREPIFSNHPPSQAIYMDFPNTPALSKNDRLLIKSIENISHLFTLGRDVFEDRSRQRISYCSLEINTIRCLRSQTVYDAHVLLHSALGSDGSILLTKHDDSVIVSLAGFGQGCILSDWYLMQDDYSALAERLDIINLSLSSAFDFFFDLKYSIARKYYLYPITYEMAMHSLTPEDYRNNYYLGFYNREALRELVTNAFFAYQIEYGDDYVEPTQYTAEPSIDVGAELDLMLLDMDMDEDSDDNPFDEDLSEFVDDYEDDGFFEESENLDLDDLDPEIFKDANLLVKWLEKNEKNDE